MGIFVVVPLGGTSNESGVDDDGNFRRFEWPAVLYGDMLPLVGQ